MRLWHGKTRDTATLITRVHEEDEAGIQAAMKADLERRKVKVFYTRRWIDPDHFYTVVDYGSWSEFYFITE